MPDLAIENGVVKLSVALTNLPEVDAKFDSFIANLQKKCNLKLTIDSAALDASSAAIANKIAKTATSATKASSKSSKDFDDRRLNSFFNAQQRMALRLRDMGATTSEYERFVQLLNDVKANGGKGFEKLASASIDAQHSVQVLNKELRDTQNELDKSLRETQAFERNRAQVAGKLTDGWFASERARLDNSYTGADQSLVQSARTKLQEIRDLGDVSMMTRDQFANLNEKISEYNNLVSQISKTNSANRAFEDQATALANLRKEYASYMAKFGENLRKNPELFRQFRELGVDIQSGVKPANELQRSFADLTAQSKASGAEIETVRQRMSNLFGKHFNTALIMLAIRGLHMALRQLWQDIKEVNEALVQTQIVTGLSGAALLDYTDKAYDAAERSRDKITNVLGEATAYGRLGYDAELSVQLAELTSMYSKLGDVDTSDATDAITALMKAFDLKSADEIEAVLDKMIYVGNNFPISAAGLGEGLNNAASALSASGNSLEQTLALLMTANATVQNPAKSSTATRTMTARIRNSKAELEELGEEMEEQWNTVSKYRDQMLGISGVDILDETGKEFRSTADILRDLARVWTELSSVEQATITTMVAGTRNQDIFASIMKNWDSYEEAMAGMGDASGLMNEKFEAVENSISGALNGLSNAWSRFSNTLFNSQDVTNFIRLITSLVNIFERLTKTIGGGAFIAGALAVTTFMRSFKQFGQIYPQMQAAMSSLRGIYSGTGNILNPSQLSATTQALSGFTNAQQRAIMTAAGFPTAAQAQVLSLQGMSTAGIGASGAMSTLGASVDGLKMKMTAFVQSGNIWITLIMLVVQLITTVNNIIQGNAQDAERAAEEARQRAKEAQSDARAAIQSNGNILRSFENGDKSADSYQEKIEAIADKLADAAVGSEEYKSAKLELYSVQKEIIDQFGEESGAIRGVTEDLSAYASRLDDVAKKSAYLSLTDPEHYSGTASALRLFGITPEGKSSGGNSPVYFDNVLITSDAFSDLRFFGTHTISDSERNEATASALKRMLGDDLIVSLESTVKDAWNEFNPEKVNGNLLSCLISDEFAFDRVSIDSITFSGTAREIVDKLSQRVEYFSTRGDSRSAAFVSDILKQYKNAVGYDDALQIFQTWASGRIQYGEAKDVLGSSYGDLVATKTAYDSAMSAGDVDAARQYLSAYFSMLDEFVGLAHSQGYDWAAEFAQGMMDGLDDRALMNDLLDGKLKSHYSLSPSGDVYLPFRVSSVYDLTTDGILAASAFETRADAAEAGMTREYNAYMNLSSAAKLYGTTIEHLLTLLSKYYGLESVAGSKTQYTYSTFHNNVGSGLDVNDPFSNESVLKATGTVASIKDASDKLFDAEAVRNRIKEAFDSGAEIAQEDIDAIKEYVGDTFEEIDEDVLASIDETLSESRDEISTSIEGLSNSAIKWMEENVEGFNLADYIDTDTGEIDFSGIMSAFQNSGVEDAAGAAGANASMAYLSQLQTVGGASIRAKLDSDGLGYQTEFNGGGASSSGPQKKSGGGGGGKRSKLSTDIENVERMIALFRTLLNYYEEGSDQWITRQTQLIDKYKAGVEIAMSEYNRLKNKGLKETDDDVKKVVDAILDYQDNIFEESKKLWEAVRQNQIDTLDHLKDQNDAAIELENTHHDLLIAIRNERRELEDELKAARDAYSEVMTPEELNAMFSVEDYADLMDKLASIEGDAMSMYRDYKEQIASVSEDETYMIDHITDEFKRQYDLKMKEYEIAKAELGVARAQQELDNVKNEQTVMMLIGGKWQWVADPERVLDAEQKLADAEQELADAQDEFNFQSLIHSMEAQSSDLQKQIDALEALTFSMDNLAEQIHLFSDSVYKELLSYLSNIAQQTMQKYEGSTAIPAFADGGVIRRSGLALVHSGEPIFSTYDAEKLWRFVHDLGDEPINTTGIYAGLARKMIDIESPGLSNTHSVSIDNSINIPGGIHVHGEQAHQLIALLKEIVAPYQPNI